MSDIERFYRDLDWAVWLITVVMGVAWIVAGAWPVAIAQVALTILAVGWGRRPWN